MVAAVAAEPGFFYSTVDHTQPASFYNVPLVHHTTAYSAPLVYSNPVVHHSVVHNVVPYQLSGCTNVHGQAVPCNLAGGYAVVKPAMMAAQPEMKAEEAPMEKEEMPAEEAAAVVSVEKRDAEAEADPFYFYSRHFAVPYYGHHPYHHAFNYGYFPYVYGGCRNNMGALVPCA